MKDRVRVELQPRNEVIQVAQGASLSDVLFGRGVEFPCGGEGYCRGCRVRVLGGDLPITARQRAGLSQEELSQGWRLACCSIVEQDLVLEIAQWEEVILGDDRTPDFKPQPGLGIAVDVGTTTLVAQLLNRSTGVVLGVETALNPQAVRGGDIMSRVNFAVCEAGRCELRDAVRRAVGDMIERLLAVQGVDAEQVCTVTLVGNTVMHHLFCGFDVEPLSHYPFESANDGLCVLRGGDLGWVSVAQAEVLFLPCLGSFVGSDILAGILAMGIHQSESLVALMDLGTNGEIVVGNRSRLLCASAAAGPAFEGARISMGMRAATGAISEVRIREGKLECHVLGGGAPRGVCGSGLVDAVAAGLESGAIRPDGRLADGGMEFMLLPPVRLTQKDIRELQLAKAAIAAGLQLLLGQWGAGPEDIQTLYLAGAFGNYVSRTSARRIGLFDCPPQRVRSAGNTALLGAKLALFADSAEESAYHGIRRQTTHVPLASDPRFEDAFLSAMRFPDR